MKKRESLFLGVSLVAALCVVGAIAYNHRVNNYKPETQELPTSRYGAFLAAQHAIYVNDFDTAAKYMQRLNNEEYAVVNSARYMAEFLSGKLPEDAPFLKDEKSIPSQLIYDAYLLQNDKWEEVYKRHKSDSAALSAPLRIWASVATGRVDDALKFVDALPTAKSWKNFARGQIYAETGNVAKAAASFAEVSPEFMNINDYLYMMSFYIQNSMKAEADALKSDFTSRPGGMFMAGYDKVPNWFIYSGHKNALAFSLVQNVSHTQILMYSDLAILMLRFAQITGPEFGAENNTINYYLGQFFFNNHGNWAQHFAKIDADSPFYTFATLRTAEGTNNLSDLQKMVEKNPLFVPAINKIVAQHVKNGERRAALRTVNRALDNKNITNSGRGYFLKSRAQINYAFGDIKAAQKDLHSAAEILVKDEEILALQAKIWAAQNREIETAYEYAMKLIIKNPSDLIGWDALGRVVAVREGDAEALELIARVGQMANYCSGLFDFLGDLYARNGDTTAARDAYMRAIKFADDGMVVVPHIQKKLRKLK